LASASRRTRRGDGSFTESVPRLGELAI
jgi:hypothetical protein